MTEKYFFADVETPFHVWVKEGSRWVLRDAGAQLHLEGSGGGERTGSGIKPSKAG